MSLFSVSNASAIDNQNIAEKNVLNQLILLLSQETHAENADLIQRFLQQRIDWQTFCGIADEQRVFSIVSNQLDSLYRAQLDPQILFLLRDHRQQIVRRNLGLTAQLLKLTNLLEQNQIPVLTYKGAAFANVAYGDATARQFTDLDLLIGKSDFAKAKEIFVANRCFPAQEENLTEKLERAILRYDYEMPFLAGNSQILVELHWQLAEHFFSFNLEWRELWKRRIETKILGRNVLTLSIEDSLIVHCAHASKHLWKRLGWIVDVAQLIGKRPIDWDLTIALAKKCGGLRMVWLGLWLAKEMLKAQVPPEIWQKIEADKQVARLGEKLKNYCFDEAAQIPNWKLMARRHFQMREKITDKMLYSYRLLVQTKLIDSLFMPLGRPR